MSDDIPLIKDILDIYPDTQIEDHIDSKMIEMYNNFISRKNKVIVYTDKEIYDYIKFINKTCLNIDSYKHVVNYINKHNINYFESLFDNYDILCELLPLLPYDIASQCEVFNNPVHNTIKEKWISHNMIWVRRYRTDLLEPYIKLEIFTAKYYVINKKVYSNLKKFNLKSVNYIAICDMPKMCEDGHLDLVKYTINAMDEYCGSENVKMYLESLDVLINCICHSVCSALANEQLEIVEYLIEYLKSKDALHLIKGDGVDPYIRSSPYWLKHSTNSIKSMKFLLENKELAPYIDEHKDLDLKLGLFRSAENIKIDVMDFIINEGIDVNSEIQIKIGNGIPIELVYIKTGECIDLLTISSYHGHFEVVKYLIDKNIDIDKYGVRAIRYASKKGHNMIIVYIINKLMDTVQSNNNRMENLINIILRTGNKEIMKYVMRKYYTFRYICNKMNIYEIFTSAYMGGQIEFIEEFYNMLSTNDNLMDNHANNSMIIDMLNETNDMICIINLNSEIDCINFVSFMNENEIKILCKHAVITTCIAKGYIELLIYILKDPHTLIENNMMNHNIISCINSSTSEKSCMLLINWICRRDLKKLDVPSILYISVRKGYLNLMKYVYDENVGKENLSELLLIACDCGHFEIMKFLIEMGADISYKDGNYCGYIYYNGVSRIMTERCKNFEMMKYMIDNGMDFNYILSSSHRCMGDRYRKTFIETIKYIYERELVDINNKYTYMLFSHTCEYGIHELVEYFLNKDMDMETCINNSLYKAACFNHEEIVKMILNNDKCRKFISKSNRSLVNACKNEHINIVRLLTKYVDVNSYEGAALYYTCVNENLEIVVHLIENGIDFDKYGNKALRLSAKYGLVDIVKFLVEKGADVHIIDRKYYDPDVDAYLREIGINIEFDKPVSNIIVRDENNIYYSEDDIENYNLSDSSYSEESDDDSDGYDD